MARLVVAALLAAIACAAAHRTVLFLEQDFFGPGAPQLTRIANVSATHGGTGFHILSLMTWQGDFAPNATAPLPEPDAGAVAALLAARAAAPAPLQAWGGVSLCPGPEYACMLNSSLADLTGTQLAARVVAAGLDGVIIYVSPYCNNANCKKTTGKYAEGIAAIVRAFRAAAPATVRIALPLNEWDNPQIVAPAGPAAILSWQTVFYFTSITDCQADCGALCGAGENSVYVVRAGRNYTGILQYLADHNVTVLGQFAGASTPEANNPPDFWSALTAYAGPNATSSAITTNTPTPVMLLPIIADWGGQGDAPFTRPGELDTAAALGQLVGSLPPAITPAVLALGDNLYPMGACNDASLPPYNATCPGRDAPGAGTAEDPRFKATFEQVFTHPALAATPFMLVAGNQDAIGNVSASIAYTALSNRWRHPGYWYRLTTQQQQQQSDEAAWQPQHSAAAPVNGAVVTLNAPPLPGGATLDILMLDVTLCYGVYSDPVHTAMCDEQLAWFQQQLMSNTASFLFVGTHYPIWSGCAHGSTQWAIDALLPLMLAANVTGYMSGHDHCGEFLAPATSNVNASSNSSSDMVFLVAGTGDGCCYGEPNIGYLPRGALKFLLSAAYNPTNATAGFATLRVDALPTTTDTTAVVRFEYHAADDAASLLYTSPALLPRTPIVSSSGAVIGMAAPDYAAAGLPRPSDVSPAGNYTSSPSSAEPPAAPPPFQATLWLYAPSADNATWSSWYDTLSVHRANVTGIAPCSYLLDGNGSFTTQFPNASAAAAAAQWTSRMVSELGLRALPLLAASGTGMNLLLADATLASSFIAATVQEATAVGLSGYNVQLEEPGNATIKAAWLSFLGNWLDAAAEADLTLSIIIGGDCRGKDWMFVDCGDYRVLAAGGATPGAPPRPNLRVITEATYTGEPSAWKDYLDNIVRGLGANITAPGLEYGPPLENPGNGCLPAAAAAGVRELYVWVDPPAGSNTTVAATWAALGWWVAGAQGP